MSFIMMGQKCWWSLGRFKFTYGFIKIQLKKELSLKSPGYYLQVQVRQRNGLLKSDSKVLSIVFIAHNLQYQNLADPQAKLSLATEIYLPGIK